MRIRCYGQKWRLSREFIHRGGDHPLAYKNTWDLAYSLPFKDCLPLVRYIRKPKGCTEYTLFNELGAGYGGLKGTMELVPGDPTFNVDYKIYCTLIHVLKVISH